MWRNRIREAGNSITLITEWDQVDYVQEQMVRELCIRRSVQLFVRYLIAVLSWWSWEQERPDCTSGRIGRRGESMDATAAVGGGAWQLLQGLGWPWKVTQPSGLTSLKKVIKAFKIRKYFKQKIIQQILKSSTMLILSPFCHVCFRCLFLKKRYKML